MRRIRIVLADDHNLIRSGLRLLLERQEDLEVVGEAGDGRAAVECVERTGPDVVVLDIAMPLLNGIEAARQIAARFSDVKIVILSMHSDESYVIRALKAGARAYLLKDSAETDLISAVRAVTAGRAFFSPTVSKVLAEDYVRQLRLRDEDDSYELLTSREREVLQLLAEGKSNKEVASVLGISLYTAETHRGNIIAKLNIHSVPELILYAVRKGIIS